MRNVNNVIDYLHLWMTIRKNIYGMSKNKMLEYIQSDDIILIDKMTLTPSGKINYRKLEEMAENNK